MQKVYQRINWENDPSTNTPLSEDNLNKMDYALYELDKRVLTLGGYEERAALSATNAETSEINAKTSENNSKVSETNAKTSEANAKGYMEKAFAGTPEGYAQLVEDVSLLDIAKSTDLTLNNSKKGGLKFNHIKGATEQNGTPTPSSPIGIKNVGDCVEMMQGAYSTDTGEYINDNSLTCNKYKIPCNVGDIIGISVKSSCDIYVLYYNASGYVGFDGKTGANATFTVPSNVTHFNFRVKLHLTTADKIQLTVNGKYVTPIKSHGKNELDCSGLVTTATNGVTFTPIYNSNGELEYINVNGTATSHATYHIGKISVENGVAYAINGIKGGSSTTHMLLGQRSLNGAWVVNTYFFNETSFTPDATYDELDISIVIASGATVSNLKFYPMIRKADITDDTYEPYQESVATILLNEPLRDGDILFKDNGVWTVERNVVEETYDGSSDESWLLNGTSDDGSGNSVNIYQISRSNVANVSDTDNQVRVISDRLVGSTRQYYTKMSSCCVANNQRIFISLSATLVTSLAEFKTWLSNNPTTVQYELKTPTYEVLDTASQIALNSLETFDTVTYIEVDSRVQPSEIEVEYGTSKVGGYSLEALRNSKNNEKAIEENMKAITSGEVVVEYESEDDFAGRSWINVVTLMAGEKLKNILNMISAMFNNIRFLRNEVNKKMDANYGYLTEGDLNNIIYESGKAYCTTNVANIPIMGRGWLEVLMSDDADMVLQRYTTAVGNKVFIRRLVKSTSNGWGEWSKCNLTSDDIVVDMVAKPATMNLPAWASVSIEIESKYLSLEYELLSANVYFVDDLSSGTLSDSNLCVDQVMTSTNTASAHCCVAKVRNASSSQINKGCYSVARFVLVKK